MLNDISDHLQDILVALEKDVNGMVKLLHEIMNGCSIYVILNYVVFSPQRG